MKSSGARKFGAALLPAGPRARRGRLGGRRRQVLLMDDLLADSTATAGMASPLCMHRCCRCYELNNLARHVPRNKRTKSLSDPRNLPKPGFVFRFPIWSVSRTRSASAPVPSAADERPTSAAPRAARECRSDEDDVSVPFPGVERTAAAPSTGARAKASAPAATAPGRRGYAAEAPVERAQGRARRLRRARALRRRLPAPGAVDAPAAAPPPRRRPPGRSGRTVPPAARSRARAALQRARERKHGQGAFPDVAAAAARRRPAPPARAPGPTRPRRGSGAAVGLGFAAAQPDFRARSRAGSATGRGRAAGRASDEPGSATSRGARRAEGARRASCRRVGVRRDGAVLRRGGRAPVDRSAQSQCVEPAANADVADDDDDGPAFGSDASSEASESPPPAPFHAPTPLRSSAPAASSPTTTAGRESYALDGGTSVAGGRRGPRRVARVPGRARDALFAARRGRAPAPARASAPARADFCGETRGGGRGGRTYRCDRTACLADVPSPPALRRQHATVYRERLQIQQLALRDWDDIDIFLNSAVHTSIHARCGASLVPSGPGRAVCPMRAFRSWSITKVSYQGQLPRSIFNTKVNFQYQVNTKVNVITTVHPKLEGQRGNHVAVAS